MFINFSDLVRIINLKGSKYVLGNSPNELRVYFSEHPDMDSNSLIEREFVSRHSEILSVTLDDNSQLSMFKISSPQLKGLFVFSHRKFIQFLHRFGKKYHGGCRPSLDLLVVIDEKLNAVEDIEFESTNFGVLNVRIDMWGAPGHFSLHD